MATTNKTDVVFTGTADWWQIVSGRNEVVCDEQPWCGEWERAAKVAGIDTDDPESWVAKVAAADERHGAILPGDYACCQGIGSDVIFVRLEG